MIRLTSPMLPPRSAVAVEQLLQAPARAVLVVLAASLPVHLQ
jgi:hypothetical protein